MANNEQLSHICYKNSYQEMLIHSIYHSSKIIAPITSLQKEKRKHMKLCHAMKIMISRIIYNNHNYAYMQSKWRNS